MKFTFRTPIPDDAATFARVRLASWRAAYGSVFAEEVFTRQEELPARTEGYRWWFERLDETGCDDEAITGARRQVIVAEGEEGGLLGFVMTRKMPGEELEVQMLYTLPETFGSGLGKQLLQAVLKDKEPAFLEVLSANHRARKFYEKNGFDYTGKTGEFSGRQTLTMRRAG